DKNDETPVFFEISSAADQMPIVHFEMLSDPPPVEKQAPAEQTLVVPAAEVKPEPEIIVKQEASTPVSSTGGYLVKPVNIYVEEAAPEKQESKSVDEPATLQITVQEDEPATEMQMV